MNRIVVFVMLLVLMNIGCNNTKNEKMELCDINVNIIPSKDTLKLSSIFRSYKIIPLQGINLSDIIDVNIIDSLLIIQSKSNNTDLHIFNNKGMYLKSLVNYGKSNDEVLNIQAFSYNEYLKTIDVLCNYGMNIYQCDMSNKKILNRIKIPKEQIFSVLDFEIIDSSRYILYKNLPYTEDDEYKLYVYNYQDDKIENQFLKLDKKIAENVSIGQKNNLYKKDSVIYFYECFLNGIYEYNSDRIKKHINFEENTYSFPNQLLSNNYKNESDFIRKCIDCNYIWAHINCIQYNNTIFSFYTYKNDVYGNLINTKNVGESNSYYYLCEDLISSKVLSIKYFRIISSNNDYLIGYFEKDIIKEGHENSYIILFDNSPLEI